MHKTLSFLQTLGSVMRCHEQARSLLVLLADHLVLHTTFDQNLVLVVVLVPDPLVFHTNGACPNLLFI